MQHLTKLFKLIELTRSQPQTGYALAGIAKQDLSDLAQHHYLVSFIAWQLARNLKAAGADINVEKVLEFAMIHDLGELLGGDISMPYAKANPRAYRLAKQFESENQRYLTRFFGKTSKHYKFLGQEILKAKSDEAIIAKIADYLEVVYYKAYVGLMTSGDVEMSVNKIRRNIKKLKDKVAKAELEKFMGPWSKEMKEHRNREFFEDAKGS
ncbi:MAG: HD domain-containing protein [Candidatus Doudnabacteria bacterium]|nr:HD domain-containing protein [Candidatus Doudnabacteria bacterium]